MRKILLIATAFILSNTDLAAQQLSGRVLTERGMNASGVTVSFKNKANTVITKADGTFKILATKLPDTLVFSGVGLEPYKVVITEKNISDPNFEVVLLNTRKTLDEVVVRGYGTAESRKALGFTTITPPSVSSDFRTDSYLYSAPGIMIDKSVYKPDAAGVRGFKSSSGLFDSGINDKFYSSDTNITPRTGQLAKSRILTAGEVNDFNKWKMWEDYSENEFKSYSEKWKMKTGQRFSLQLTGKDHQAVINEPVFLIHKKTNDTVWRAWTDNTGKAELWAGFTGDSVQAVDYYISDRYRHTVGNPSGFANGVNVLRVDKTCQVSDVVDIAFVVDATGSMGDEIEFLKLELEDVIRNTMETYSSLTLRASSVFYRDKGDEYLRKMNPFSDDLLKTLNFIKLQRADGGGDFEEAVDDAMAMALDSLQWSKEARAKILFLVLDAPPHADAVERMQKLTMKAAAMGIRIVPIACSDTDKSTEFLMRSMALATNGTYTFLTNHSGVGGNHIEPTTDKYQVELLNNLLRRVISQFLFARDCNNNTEQEKIKQPENILSVKIYPNPTNGRFTVESNKELKEIFIADFSGKLLMRLTGNAKQTKWAVDISNYPSGAYLVKYITAENKWGAEKVILVR